ncbi:hypothetical protein LX36DRAFT_45525 [Colletotrichum falcatum]|nr:hypothetical protein LX36DRAFT_45525 [Colletotrichum falcatum]
MLPYPTSHLLLLLEHWHRGGSTRQPSYDSKPGIPPTDFVFDALRDEYAVLFLASPVLRLRPPSPSTHFATRQHNTPSSDQQVGKICIPKDWPDSALSSATSRAHGEPIIPYITAATYFIRPIPAKLRRERLCAALLCSSTRTCLNVATTVGQPPPLTSSLHLISTSATIFPRLFLLSAILYPTRRLSIT